MANTNLTYDQPAVDCLGSAFPAIGAFKNKGGHTPAVEIYTHLSSTVAGDYVLDAIGDVLLKSRAGAEVSASNGCMNPVVLCGTQLSGFSPTLDASVALCASASVLEIDFDAITTDSTTMKLGQPYPLGSLDRPL